MKAHYPLGPVWNASGKTIATNRGGPPPPQAPAVAQSSSSRPKQGMSAVFDEINSGKSVTSGNHHFSFHFLCQLKLLSSLSYLQGLRTPAIIISYV